MDQDKDRKSGKILFPNLKQKVDYIKVLIQVGKISYLAKLPPERVAENVKAFFSSFHDASRSIGRPTLTAEENNALRNHVKDVVKRLEAKRAGAKPSLSSLEQLTKEPYHQDPGNLKYFGVRREKLKIGLSPPPSSPLIPKK